MKYDINEILLNDSNYKEITETLKNEITTEDYNKSNEIITLKTPFNKSLKINKGRFLTVLVLAKSFNIFKIKIDQEKDLFLNTPTSSNLNDYFSHLILKIRDHKEDYNLLCNSISQSLQEISHISGIANYRTGNTISIYNIIQTAFKNPEVFDIINCKIPKNLDFTGIEEFIERNQKRLIEILRNDKDSVLYNFLNSESGINIKQFEEIFVSLGFKADIRGNIIPEAIDTNLIRGFRNIKDFYINAISARKALILTFSNVKESGYLTRKLSLLQVDTNIDYNIEKCDSQHYLDTNVNNQRTFQRIQGKVYFDGESEKVITLKDTHLIGKIIKMRSPITCNSESVCRRCYGYNLAELNKDIHCGILSVLILTNQLTQRLLSAKHLLATKSKKIEWPDSFKKNFIIDKNIIKVNSSTDLSNVILNFKLIKEEDDSGDVSYKVNRFKIIVNKNTEIVNPGVSFIPTEEFSEYLKSQNNTNGRYSIPIDSINDMSIFTINIENTELSHILKHILKLIESNIYLKDEKFQNFNYLYNYMIMLLNESNIKIHSSHVEMILRSLIRKKTNLTKRIKFNKKEIPEYRIIRVSKAIINSKSVSTSLVFERIKHQLIDLSTYKKKKYSIIDELIR